MQEGGLWLPQEADFHINCLEFKAALFALERFATRLVGEHFRLLTDNTTAGSCTNHMDTSRDSHHCNEKPSAFRNHFVGSPHPRDQRISLVGTPPWEIRKVNLDVESKLNSVVSLMFRINAYPFAAKANH